MRTKNYLFYNRFRSTQAYRWNMFRFVRGTDCLYSWLDTINYSNFHIPHAHNPNMLHLVCGMSYLYRRPGTEYYSYCHKHQCVYILYSTMIKDDFVWLSNKICKERLSSLHRFIFHMFNVHALSASFLRCILHISYSLNSLVNNKNKVPLA